MPLSWIAENPPLWDQNKQRLVGEAPEGIFDRRYSVMKPGDLVPGDWWRVEQEGRVVGYGWLDVVWGDAEVLLVTEPGTRKAGVGSFILENLAREARERGLNYLYNVVRPTHPEHDATSAWLKRCGFSQSEDGSLLRSSSQSAAATAVSS